MHALLLILAPMDDVTDVVFRSIIADCAPPDMFFTEFVNVDGLQSPGRPKLIHKLTIDRRSDSRIVAQIWGKIRQNYEVTAAELVEMGFDGVDINMGCPEKAVVKNGCCSALIQDRALAGEIIRAVQNGVAGRVPVSVKTRLGWDEIDLSWLEFLLSYKLNMLTIHLRTRQEMSEVPAHWDLMSKIISLRDRMSPRTQIIGNGDVAHRAQAINLAQETGCDGVMIGRGVFKDPYCFVESSPWPQMMPSQKIDLYRTHVERFIERYGETARNFQSLKKFCKIYINGFDHAADMREKLMEADSALRLLRLLRRYTDETF